MPTNLACFIPCVTDATSLYRGVGPIAELRRAHGNVTPCFTEKIDWSVLKLMDIAFMQRCFTPHHGEIANMIKTNHLPLWVDYDDLLTDIPAFNPNHASYASKEVQATIREILSLADIVSVSTPAIAEAFAPFTKAPVVVVPNAYDPFFLGNDPLPPKEKIGRIVLWRGSATHRADLNVLAEAAIALSFKHEDVTWVFVGDNPWFTEYMHPLRVLSYKSLDPMEYGKFLREIRADLLVVPLVDNAFNRAKSNCAWLEASSAGTAVLAPAWPEWQRPGITNYETNLGDVLDKLLTGPVDALPAFAAQSKQYIRDNLMLADVNKLRLQILDTLIS